MANTNYGQNGFLVQGASSTQGPFDLLAGKYGITVVATGFGTVVSLQTLGPDGSTYVNVVANFTANGYASADLPSGLYQVAITGATGVNMAVTPISNRR